MAPGRETGRVVLGVITKPHGVRGEVRVHPFNAESDLFKQVSVIDAGPEDGETKRLTIARASRGPKAWRLKLKGVDTIEAAELLRGHHLSLPRAELPEIDEYDYYYVDLEGLEVLAGDESIGEVLRVLEYPSVDCLEVKLSEGRCEIPMREPWLLEVNVGMGFVRVGDLEDIPVQGKKKKGR